MSIKHQLISELEKVLKELGIFGVAINVDYPADPKNGDYSSNIAMAIFGNKELGTKNQGQFKTPLDLANKIADKFSVLSSKFKVAVAPPGFINFWIKDELLGEALKQDDLIPDIGKERKVIVEYSSPNIAKPFTIGHLRSTIIGDAVANLLEATGWKVYRDNHLGDWGTQFGKQIYAIKQWGNEQEIENSERPVKLLVDLYVKFHEEAEKDPKLEDTAREWFKKLEDGDKEAKRLWQKCIDWSWKEFEAIYKQLNVKFTENNGRGYGESFFEDKMPAVIEELQGKGLLKEGKEGARLIFFPNDPSASSGQAEFTPLMILKKDGATLYSTRDLATDKFRLEHYGKDVKVINEVGAEQAFYFKQLYKAEEMLGWYKKGQRIHKMHGLYRFKEGKMSTRKGNVIWLEEVLYVSMNQALALIGQRYNLETHQSNISGVSTIEFATKKANKDKNLTKEEIKKNAWAVGIGALKWNDLKRSSEQDINFDWDEILNMQGNSGPYIQYTFARTQSVVAKDQRSKIKDQKNWKLEIGNWKLEIEERSLLLLLSRFPEIVAEAAERLSPNLLCTYLFELAQNFNLFYQKCPILKPKGKLGESGREELDSIRSFRLGLTQATGGTLKKGLYLLGISAPEKM